MKISESNRDERIAQVLLSNKHLFKWPLSDYKFKDPVAALEFFAFEHQVSVATLTGRSTVRSESNVRRDAMRFLFCTCPSYSTVEIARLFDRDHTTLLYALGVVLNARRKDNRRKRNRLKKWGTEVFLSLGSVTDSGKSLPENQEVSSIYQFRRGLG